MQRPISVGTLPDDFELAVDLDPQDPVDALEDLDGDGLSNLREFELGTRLDDGDSDGDGLADGEEVAPGRDGFVTSPLLADSDGDGVRDGLEISVGTDPTDRTSVDYEAVLVGLTIEPAAFSLINNTLLPDEVSRRVRLTGLLVNETEADLTSRPEVTYRSSDLEIASRGAEPGRIFAGQDGTAVVTATLGGRSAETRLQVTTVSPQTLAFLPIPGFANSVAAGEGVVYVAAGTTGLQIIDVSDPSAPFIGSALDTPGNARGIDADQGLAVVADATGGVHVVDLTDPAALFLVGSTHTRGTASSAADVVLRGPRAFVTGGSNRTLGGVKVIDLTDPTTPAVVGATGDGFGLTGIALDRNLALASDYFFVNAVAVRGGLVFLAGAWRTILDNGTSADTGLHIGRYAVLGDDLGIAPAVELISPTSGTSVLERRLLTLEATASDDVLVDAVTFVVDGEPVGGDFSPPYDLDFQVPGDGDELLVEAVSTDLAGNRAVSDAARVTVLPDSDPSVRIVSPTTGYSVVESSILFVRVSASDDEGLATVNLLIDGSIAATPSSIPFSFGMSVPLGASELTLTATAVDTANQATTSEPVVLSVVPDRPPAVEIVEPLDGQEIVEGDRFRVVAGTVDDVGIASVRFFVDGVETRRDIQEPFEHELAVPTGVGEVTVSAEATDRAGQTASSLEIALPVIADPGATLVGSVVTEDGSPVADATVVAPDATTISFADGSFRLESLPSILGPIQLRVTAETSGGLLQGSSAPVSLVPGGGGGVVDVGAVVIRAQVSLGMAADVATRSVVVFDSANNTVLGSVFLGGRVVGDCSITADQTLGYVTDFQDRLWVIDLGNNPPSLAAGINPISISNPGEDTSITPDEQSVLVCDGGSVDPVSVVDIDDRTEVATFDLGSNCNSVDVCSDGSVLVTSTRANSLRRLTVDSFGTLSDTGESLILPGEPNNVTCAPGAASGVVIQAEATVLGFTIPGLAETSRSSVTGRVGLSAAFDAVGENLYTKSNLGGLDFFSFDPSAGMLGSSPRLTVPLRDGAPFFGMDQLALGPGGTEVYVSQPNAVNVYDAATGELLTRITDPALVEPTGVCFPQSR